MNLSLFICVLIILGGVSVFVGTRTKKKQKTSEDYFLMGRELCLFPLFFTFLATQLGGGTLLGAAEEAYHSGWVVLLYPLGASLGLIFLGLGFGARYNKFKISTTAELFETVYKSKFQRKLASIISVFTSFVMLIAMAVAANKFFLSIGFNSLWIFSCLWLSLVLYTVMGGLRAVVNTDILQTLFILFSISLALITLKQPEISYVSYLECTTQGSSDYLKWLLMPLLYMPIEQEMGQRCFAAKNSKAVSIAAVMAAVILMLSSSVGIFFGILAKKYRIPIGNDSSVLIEAVKQLTPNAVATLFSVAVLMAIISTADSLLCSISSNISFDFLSKLRSTEKSRVLLSKMSTALIGVIALILSFSFQNVISVLMFSFEIPVSMLLVPTLGALFLKRPNKVSSSISILTGAVCFVTFMFLWRASALNEGWILIITTLSFVVTESIVRFRKKVFL